MFQVPTQQTELETYVREHHWKCYWSDLQVFSLLLWEKSAFKHFIKCCPLVSRWLPDEHAQTRRVAWSQQKYFTKITEVHTNRDKGVKWDVWIISGNPYTSLCYCWRYFFPLLFSRHLNSVHLVITMYPVPSMSPASFPYCKPLSDRCVFCKLKF